MSLYLKYRPQDFNNLVGQHFVKTTLQKAITDKKIVGAYLLCGPRGTGKTSTARILAKTINCLNPNNGNPCLECEICTDFLKEKLIDIIEIDAASHTGVDNIRDLIEKAQFSPTKTKFKVYIIDEVHMLSKGAFNALLKILEEPPKHVKFILATTETHKVPETIISRCQRYDFRRISNKDIETRLNFIANNEGVTIDEKSLNYIINNSGGGLRNAISTFEQHIVDNKIVYEELIEKIGIVGSEILNSFLEKLLNKDNSIINEYDKLIESGKNIKLFFKEFIFYIKNECINKIKRGDNISNELEILEAINDTYSKSKNSMDENLSFLIGILNILNPRKIETKVTQTENITNKANNNITTPNTNTQSNTNITESQKQDITMDDIGDIFADSSSSNTQKTQQTPPVQTNNSSNFDKAGLINIIKDLGGKGGLTMALRGSKLNLDGNILTIKVKTTIAHNQTTNADNGTLILEALKKTGIEEPKLNINR